MKTITTIITALIIFTSLGNRVNAQLSYKEKAKTLISNYEYVKAIALYNESFNSNKLNNEDFRNIAYCYLQINDTRNAKEWLTKLVLTTDPSPKDVLQYAHLLKTEANYDEAITQYKRYQKLVPQDPKTKEWIASSELAITWMKNPESYEVVNMKEINSENSDFGLMPFKNGFIFTSDRKQGGVLKSEEIYGWTGNPYLKMYYVPDQTKLNKFDAIKTLNGDYHNGPSNFQPVTNKIYFTRTKMVKVSKKNLNNDPTNWIEDISTPEFENRLEIFTASSADDNSWYCLVEFPYNKPDEFSVGHPTLSQDGNTLYFVSDMPGGYGATDIYYCVKNSNEKWSSPLNAGSTINTSGKELFPFIDKNGVLYFSSDGHKGMGGLDIYKSTGSKNEWSEPENMKFPINSPKDDFSLFFDNSTNSGYLSSNRDGGKGSDDIYRFRFVSPTDLTLIVTIKGTDEKNKPFPLEGAKLKIIDNTNPELNYSFQSIEGRYVSNLKCNHLYEITGSKEGYFPKSETVKTKCISSHDTIFVELLLVKLEVDIPIVLKNIYYDFDKSFIRPDAKPELEKVVQIMKENPNIVVELGSHTDSRGTDVYNIDLSDRRAKAAVEYIISRGISKTKITAKGYGETMLLNECKDDVPCSDEAHQLNRRTEFKITGFIKGKNQVIVSKE